MENRVSGIFPFIPVHGKNNAIFSQVNVIRTSGTGAISGQDTLNIFICIRVESENCNSEFIH